MPLGQINGNVFQFSIRRVLIPDKKVPSHLTYAMDGELLKLVSSNSCLGVTLDSDVNAVKHY